LTGQKKRSTGERRHPEDLFRTQGAFTLLDEAAKELPADANGDQRTRDGHSSGQGGSELGGDRGPDGGEVKNGSGHCGGCDCGSGSGQDDDFQESAFHVFTLHRYDG
jgi:hypothetical protein